MDHGKFVAQCKDPRFLQIWFSSTKLTVDEKRNLFFAPKYLEEYTCLRFVKKQQEDQDYIEFSSSPQ